MRIVAWLLGIALGLIAGGAALSWAGMPLAPDAQPLRVGGAYGGDDPRLLGFRGNANPTGPFEITPERGIRQSQVIEPSWEADKATGVAGTRPPRQSS